MSRRPRGRALRPLALMLLALLLVPTAGAAWTQQGGGPARSSAIGATGLLDVVDTMRIAREGEVLDFRAQLPLVETSLGLVGILVDGDDCTFVRLEDPPVEPRYGRGFACPDGARVLAYDAAREVLLACIDGAPGDAILRAFDAAGETARWSVAAPTGGTCVAPVVDGAAGVAYAGFAGAASHELAVVDLDDGTIVRRAQLAAPLFARDAVPPGGFRPSVITRADNGFLVSGAWGESAALAWLDDDLRAIRGLVAGSPDDVHGSQWAAAEGSAGAMVLGEWLVRVDPAKEGVERVPFELAGPKIAPLPHVAWGAGRILAPGARGVLGYDAASAEGEAWAWEGVPTAQVCDVLVAGGSDAYALSLLPGGVTRLVLSRLDLATGAEVQRVLVQAGGSLGNASACDGFGARMLPDAEGVLVVTRAGELARLATAPVEFVPALVLSNDYPPAGGIVELRAERPGALSFVVAWGDGVVQEGRAGDVFSHRYVQPLERTLRVTAVLSDGRTTTIERAIHVGEERPAARTFVETAFSPRWAELTYFLIGLAVTAAGALGAMVIRERRHRRLGAEQRELQELQSLAARDPAAGLAALEKHRAHLLRAHMRHHVDDAQFQLLDAKTVRIMRATRYRVLGPALNELSPHTRRLLDTALEDGRISAGERDALLGALERERLSDEEKARVAQLLREWSVEA